MTRSPLPDNWQDLMAGYTLGNLSAAEAETVQRLLTEHPDLAVEVDRLQEALAMIPQSLPDREPPAGLRDRVLTAAQTPQPVYRSDDRPKIFQETCRPAQPRYRFVRKLGVGGAVAAAVLLALALDNYRLRQTVHSTQAVIDLLQQPGAQLYALQGTDKAAQASGSVVVAANQHIVLVAKNLPAPSSGEIYRLWALPHAGAKPTYCGQFNTSQDGAISTQWAAPVAACSTRPVQMLVTLEAAADPPIPKGSLVLKSQG